MHSQYFQGIMQLRNPNKKVIEFIAQQLSKQEKLQVSRVKKVRGGLDYYMMDNNYLRQLARKVREQFACRTKSTSTLHTRDRTGKDLYRGTILLRFPSFNRGDIFTFRGERVKVLSIGETVKVQSLETGKKASVAFEDVERAITP